jgi:DNA-directed RNA polymerase specialized sigma24 family protein
VAKSRPIPKPPLSRVTPESFRLLLAALGDRAADGSHYEKLRAKLIFFFSRRLLAFPEDLADEVLDRLAHRLTQGTEMKSVEAFAVGIARFVAQEQAGRKMQMQEVDSAFFDNIPAHSATLSSEEEIVRMELCLKKLPRPESRLLKGYYLVAGKNLMEARRKLSETLNVSPTTLRQRVFLARQRLRDCITATAAREDR